MKTETSHNSDPIWTNNLELLPQEECLPIMGDCQVSTILQNLDSAEQHNVNLIIIPPGEMKMPIVENPYHVQNNYVIIKDSGILRKEKSSSVINSCLKLKSKRENFEDMLYFVCNLCPFLCTQDSKITEHLENAHKNKTVIKLPELKCPACANIFYHRMSLRSHLIHDHGVGNSDLNQIIQAVIYYSTKKKENPMVPKKTSDFNHESESASVEEISAATDLYINKHKIEQKEELKVVLPQMDITQNNSEKVISTLMKQTKPVSKYSDLKKSYSCMVQGCKVRLQSNDKITYHMNCHSDNGFKCCECGDLFLCWKPLTSHLWRSHKMDMELFACDKCDYKTVSLAKLNNIHKLIHGEVRAFSCSVCNKAFKNIKQLRNHRLIHQEKSKKLQHSCEECFKSFSYKGQLKVHMDVVHKKLKPFLCNYCGYKASSKSSLRMHSRQHTGEKPFSCDACSYSTADHNSLRRHKLRHTGQKPYKCSYCSYACIQSSTYKAHVKTQHPGMEKIVMFTCSECQFRSVNKDMYASHMMTVHMIKPSDI